MRPVPREAKVPARRFSVHGAACNVCKGYARREQQLPPIAAMAAAPTVTGLTVTFKDASFDDSSLNPDLEDPQFDLRISVSWGDGTIDTGLPGSTFEHTYMFAGQKQSGKPRQTLEALRDTIKLQSSDLRRSDNRRGILWTR